MFGNKKVVAVIPARGGSKRIPKKNILEFCGKPMIAWTIESALNSKFIDEVIVSTDCEEIARVSESYGAKVPFLRKTKADDHSPVSEATVACLNQLESLGKEFDIVIQLMANCPLRTKESIDKALISFIDNESGSQISFFEFGWMNPWWAHTIKNGVANKIFDTTLNKRSQDLDKLYCPTGAIWISNIDELKMYKTFYTKNYKSFILDWKEALDIDDFDDLEMGKALFQLCRNNH